MNKPSIPKGTRDFSPVEMAKRNYIFNTIRDVYALYGFEQIETPAMETLQTLMGKYGEEGDKLLFKILNSGNFFNKLSDEEVVQIANFIESEALKIPRALGIEEIQDMVEKQLVAHNKYEVAKAYVLYRYKRNENRNNIIS